MTYEIFWALTAYAFVSSVTPGPNNLMLMASGVNFGLRRSLPHMAGIGAGFGVMVFLVGVGLSQIFGMAPWLQWPLKAAAVVYMLYLAWKIARAGDVNQGATPARPMTFLQAALFQWVNPKAWVMALGAIAAYAPGHELGTVALVALIFVAVNLPSISLWVVMGQNMRRLLSNRRALRVFNYGMAILLVASLGPVVMVEFKF